MCKSTRKLLTARFLWFLITYSVASGAGSLGCDTKSNEKGLFANCERYSDYTFPENLDSKIVTLSLAYSSVYYINDDTFEHLSLIKYLYLEHSLGLHISQRAFEPLRELVTLNLSYTGDLNISGINLPKSLVNLYLDGNMNIKSKLPISSLENLQVLSIRKSRLNEIPSFEGNLPSLKEIDLSDNKLENFKLDSLAGLCELKKLIISSQLNIKNNCECLRFKEWIKSQSIAGSDINCKSSEHDKECSLSPSDDFRRHYESCQSESKRRNFLKIFWKCIYIIGIIIAFIAVCFSFVVLFVCCNRKNYTDDTIRAYFCCKKKRTRTMDLT